MMRISGQDFAPVITIADRVIVGFSEQKMRNLLQKYID
jgi:hypothetical protein